MKLRFYPEAEREIERAAKWYSQKRRSLGHDFLDEVQAALEQIGQHPSRYPLVMGIKPGLEIRRYLVGRFPYVVVYEIRPQSIEIISVHHGARRPGFWLRRRRKSGPPG